MEEVGSELYTYIMGNGPNAIWQSAPCRYERERERGKTSTCV